MREFRQLGGRTGERYWRVTVDGNQVITEWGGVKKDGAGVDLYRSHGTTTDGPGEKGKKGTKGYFTPEKNAQFNADRLIRKKMEEGYVELGSESSAASEIDWEKPLPKNLAFSKPVNSIKPEKLQGLEEQDELVFTWKVNGMAAIIYVNAFGDITIYSRRMEDVTENFAHVIPDLKRMKVPPKSILLPEAYMGEGKTKDDFNMMQSIMNADPPHALEMQAEMGNARFYIYRVPFWGGNHLESGDNVFWMRSMDELLWDACSRSKYFTLLEAHACTIEEAKYRAMNHSLEGWVVYKKSGSLGELGYSFHGKPNRPACAWKVKYQFEDDFSARWDPKRNMGGGHCKSGCQYKDLKQVQKTITLGKCAICGGKLVGDGTFGSGKHMGQIGTVSLYQIAPGGVPVYICEVGTGFSDEQKKNLADPVLFPLCLQIKYDDRRYRSKGDDSNALMIPRVISIREDKDPTECVNEELVTS